MAIPVALVGAALAFTFAALELGLRAIGFDPMGSLAEGRSLILRPSENPLRKFELAPNASGFAWETDVRINSHGMRDSDHPVERTGAPRVVVVGDSVTFGNGIAMPERFTEQLEILVAERLGGAIEVLNLGVGGYDTLQEVATLEELGLRFTPDLVIVGYCVNDLGDTSPNLGYIRRLRQVNSRLYRLRSVQLVSTGIDKLQLMWHLTRTNRDGLFAENNRDQIIPVSGNRELMRLRDELSERMTEADEKDLILSWYRSEAHLGKLAYALDRLVEVARAGGVDVLVAIIPFLKVSESYDVAYYMVEHLAVERGLDAVVLARRLPAAELEGLRLDPRDPVHPNERGHRMIAEALAPLVSAKLESTHPVASEAASPAASRALRP